MAPKVVVPADFGKHHLKSRSHGNMELLCAEGETIRANSMILSLNSSVIDDLVTRLDITSLDMHDFAGAAVNSFAESLYSGELENCNKTNFRDLNKMGHVFNVTWFTPRCLDYFNDLVNQLTGRNYEDMLFVVEEARYMEDNLKKDIFTELLEDKLNTMRNRKGMFLKEYSSDLGSMSINQLSMVVKLAGSDVGVLVHILLSHLKITGFEAQLSVPSKYLFRNIDFANCFAPRRWDSLTTRLYDTLMESSNEDVTFFIELLFKSSRNKACPELKEDCTKDLASFLISVQLPITEFFAFDFDSCLEFLAGSDEIHSVHHLFGAIYCWYHGKINDHFTFPDNLVREIVNIRKERCWGTVSRQYLELLSVSVNIGTDKLVRLFEDSDELSSRDNHYLLSSEQEFSIEELFTQHIRVTLKVEENMLGCTEETPCAVMIQNVPISPDKRTSTEDLQKFRLQLVTDPLKSGSADDSVHYHQTLESSQKLYLLMGVPYTTILKVRPVPFNIHPVYDNVSKCWEWGYYQFHDERVKFPRRMYYWGYSYGKNAKIKFKAIFSLN